MKVSITLEEFLERTKEYRAMRRQLEQELQDSDMSIQQWALMSIIYNNSEISCTRLAKKMDTSAPQLSEALSRLEDRRLIVDVDGDGDRRVRNIKLTGQGDRLVKATL